ncbi:MAG: hypothetical protein AB1632_14295 [Nitrospirota bacterium]
MRIKNILKNIRIVSLFLSFLYLGGFFWFLPYYMTSFHFLLFRLSTGLSLLLLPLISNAMLKFVTVRILALLIGTVGVINDIQMMIRDLTLQNGADFPAFSLRLLIIIVLAIMILRVINLRLSKEEDGIEKKRKGKEKTERKGDRLL